MTKQLVAKTLPYQVKRFAEPNAAVSAVSDFCSLCLTKLLAIKCGQWDTDLFLLAILDATSCIFNRHVNGVLEAFGLSIVNFLCIFLRSHVNRNGSGTFYQLLRTVSHVE